MGTAAVEIQGPKKAQVGGFGRNSTNAYAWIKIEYSGRQAALVMLSYLSVQS
jgi:hypothetical protein